MRALLLLAVAALAGCATNPGIDHSIVCNLAGKAMFVTTYGPVALTTPVPDANAICATMMVTPTVNVLPAAIPASGPTK